MSTKSKVGDRRRRRAEGCFSIATTPTCWGGATPFPGLVRFTLDTHLYCWVFSKEISKTIFWIFGMTRPGIEPRSPRSLANTLPTRPMSWSNIYIYIYIIIILSAIPGPLALLLPIVHHLWQVFRATSRILTELLYVCSSWSSCFAWPYAGVHRSTSLMSSSLLLQRCPACLVRLTWIVFMMGGRWPYSWCFVGLVQYCSQHSCVIPV